MMGTKITIFTRIWHFYRDGFRSMTIGRTLWVIILIKVAILFLVLKIFFFPSVLGGLTPQEQADAVARELINRSAK